MAQQSAIEWTDATWNPVRGCVKVSPGCKHCYAATFAERFRGVSGHPYEQGFDPRLVPEMLDAPLHWKKPRRVFVNSMSDLFGEFVTNEYIAACFGIMSACPQHTFQILTKRASRMREWFEWIHDGDRVAFPTPSRCQIHFMSLPCRWFAKQLIRGKHFMTVADCPTREDPMPNVHVGVSVEDRKFGLPRIDELRAVPARVRFLSIEPLLEDLGEIDLGGIDWVIVGGESGCGARRMSIEWVRRIRDQCITAGVPFFFKQWGGLMKKKNGRLLDGREWNEIPRGTNA